MLLTNKGILGLYPLLCGVEELLLIFNFDDESVSR